MAYNHFDIPIFQKAYDLYKLICTYRNSVPKADRYTTWQKVEECSLAIIELLLMVNQTNGTEKVSLLQQVSNRVDMLRIFIRLAHETKSIDQKKYLKLQELLDEIGRMLGGWMKKTRTMHPS